MVYFYMSMPVNAEGNGPVPRDEASEILHQVWDDTFSTVAECRSEDFARRIARLLNEEYQAEFS